MARSRQIFGTTRPVVFQQAVHLFSDVELRSPPPSGGPIGAGGRRGVVR